MNCSVCNRNNAVTLSICPSCGAMINDSVREELVGKISNSGKLPDFEPIEKKMTENKSNQSAKIAVSQKPATISATTEIASKHTSPTLVEFHNKNAAVPEWRLQLQNVVRQRQEREVTAEAEVQELPLQRATLITNGSNALKAEVIEKPQILQHKNPTLNSALERIEKSRRQFLEQDKPHSVITATPPQKANKNYPFYIASKTSDVAPKPAEINPPINSLTKPKLAPTSLRVEKEKLDTNKLPPLSQIIETTKTVEAQNFFTEDTKPQIEEKNNTENEIAEKIETKIETKIEISESVEITRTEEIGQIEEIEECDDCAPFAMRFNAGLFDLIIGSFVSLFLLAPFMLLGGGWLSTAGIFTFLATCAVVMFIYTTMAVGLYGRTFGMRLFSLEVVDIESSDYPTFHQAAVSSAVYLLSLALGGAGFLTAVFNADRRAVHDLVSRTIVIKE